MALGHLWWHQGRACSAAHAITSPYRPSRLPCRERLPYRTLLLGAPLGRHVYWPSRPSWRSWLSGRVPGGRLHRCLLARSLVVHAFRGQQQAPTQQIKLGAAEHLALEHLQPIDVTLDRAITPRQRDAGFDGVVIFPQPFRKPLKRLQHARRGTLQPWIELLRLSVAHQLGKILG